MDSDGVADHGRSDHGATRPSLNDILGVLRILLIHLLLKVMIHEWTFLQTTRHVWSPYRLLLLGRRRTMS